MMKNGDNLVAQMKADQKYRFVSKFNLKKHILYVPSWWDWQDFFKGRKN